MRRPSLLAIVAVNLFLFVAAGNANTLDITCQSSDQLTLRLVDLQISPAQLSTLLFFDNTVPKDSLLTSVTESLDAISVEFVNLETVSAFNFTLGKELASLDIFELDVFELGSPGSPSQTHHFLCHKK